MKMAKLSVPTWMRLMDCLFVNWPLQKTFLELGIVDGLSSSWFIVLSRELVQLGLVKRKKFNRGGKNMVLLLTEEGFNLAGRIHTVVELKDDLERRRGL